MDAFGPPTAGWLWPVPGLSRCGRAPAPSSVSKRWSPTSVSPITNVVCFTVTSCGESSANWLGRFGAAGVPAAEVEGLDRVFARPQVAALGAVQTLTERSGEEYKVVGAPMRLDHAALPYPRGAPTLGADTIEVLGELGYSADDVAKLVSSGAVVTA
jgi:hypothetical protein